MPNKDKEKNRAAFRRWYHKPGNRDKQRKRVAVCNAHFREKRRSIIDEAKASGCQACGYKKCMQALCFHHLSDKDVDVSKASTITMLRNEMKKCVVLCHNCHAELHAGTTGVW